MQFTVLINQAKALEWGMSAQQAMLFAFIYQVPSWARPVTLGDKTYYAISKAKIVEELPLLTDKPDTAYRILKALEVIDVIDLSSTSKITLVRVTEKGRQWNRSEILPTMVGNSSEVRSEILPTNQITSNQIINQEKQKQNPDAARRDWVKDLVDLGVDQCHAKDWLEVRKAKRAKMTDTALKGAQREAEKAGLTLAQAIQMAAERAWQSFKAEWLINKGIGNGRTQASKPLSAVDRVKAGAAERERARQGAQPEYFGGGDFIEGEFAAGPQADGPPLDSYGGDLWAQVD